MQMIKRWKIRLPTLQGRTGQAVDLDAKDKPVFIRCGRTLRVALGTRSDHEWGPPKLDIERRPGGWVVAIRPEGDHTGGSVVILDHGEAFFYPNRSVMEPIKAVSEFPEDINE